MATKFDWHWLNDFVGVAIANASDEFAWIYWKAGTKTEEGLESIPEGCVNKDGDPVFNPEWLRDNWLQGFLAREKRHEPHCKPALCKSVAQRGLELCAKPINQPVLKANGLLPLSNESAQRIYILWTRRNNQADFNRGAAYATESEALVAKRLK